MPDKKCSKMMEKLKQKSISATMILDSAVAYVMEQVDIVLLGVEGITANGGIINNRLLSNMYGSKIFEKTCLHCQ